MGDDDGAIEIQEFVVGFMRIQGFADKLQQYELETALHSNKMLLRRSMEMMQKFKGTQTNIISHLDLLLRELQLLVKSQPGESRLSSSLHKRGPSDMPRS